MSHEWWLDKMEDAGMNTTVVDYCIGGFDIDGKADTYGSGGSGCDSKYMYLEPVKLHLALTGDDSWEPEGILGKVESRDDMWRNVAITLYSGANREAPVANQAAVPQAGFSAPYSSIASAYTEREAGFGLQTILNACELTNDITICKWPDNIIDNMYEHLTANPDNRGNLGYLAHSWHRHEGSFTPYIGTVEQAVTESTTILINNVVSIENLLQGNTIRLSSGGDDIILTSDPISIGDGIWQLELDEAVTVGVGQSVTGGSEGGSNVNFSLATDRVFSPWMQSILADGVWQYYNYVENPQQREKAQSLLLGFASAYAAYAIDGTRGNAQTKSLIEDAYNVTIFDSDITAKTGCGLTNAPYTRYVANDLMGSANMNKAYATYMFGSGGFADQHIPEGLFQVALGIYFETDMSKKAALLAIAKDMTEWFELDCTRSQNPPRKFNWSHKSDPFGTYYWVLMQ